MLNPNVSDFSHFLYRQTTYYCSSVARIFSKSLVSKFHAICVIRSLILLVQLFFPFILSVISYSMSLMDKKVD